MRVALDVPVDPDAGDAWDSKILQGLAEIEAGMAKLIGHVGMLQRMRARTHWLVPRAGILDEVALVGRGALANRIDHATPGGQRHIRFCWPALLKSMLAHGEVRMRHRGRIISWKDDRGFGFIAPSDGGEPAFVHIKSFANRNRRPIEGDSVTYELKGDAKGRARAENARFVGERVWSASSSTLSSIPIVFGAAVVGFVASSAFVGKLPYAVLGLYLVASAVTFVAYALDKSAARKDRWRTKESTLHLFSLVGGWPGALAAQRLLRHKSKKRSFQIVSWATVVLNCAALGWLFSSSGAQALRSILGAG